MRHYYHPYQPTSVTLPPLSSLTAPGLQGNMPGSMAPEGSVQQQHIVARQPQHIMAGAPHTASMMPPQPLLGTAVPAPVVRHHYGNPMMAHSSSCIASSAPIAIPHQQHTVNGADRHQHHHASTSTSPMSRNSERRKTPSSWDPHDDMILRHLKEQLKLGWKEISSHFPNRTTNACQFRWRRLMSGTLRNKPSLESINNVVLEHHHTSISSSPSPPQSVQSASPVSAASSMPISMPPTAPTMNNLLLPTPSNLNGNGQSTKPSPALSTLSRPVALSAAAATTPAPHSSSSSPWTSEEDNLVIARPDIRELTLLLPQRAESEIVDRMNYLNRINQQQPLSSGQISRQCSGQSLGSVIINASTVKIPSSSPSPRQSPSISSVSTVASESSSPVTYSGYNFPLARPKLGKSSYFEGMRLPAPVVRVSSGGNSSSGAGY